VLVSVLFSLPLYRILKRLFPFLPFLHFVCDHDRRIDLSVVAVAFFFLAWLDVRPWARLLSFFPFLLFTRLRLSHSPAVEKLSSAKRYPPFSFPRQRLKRNWQVPIFFPLFFFSLHHRLDSCMKFQGVGRQSASLLPA